MPLAALKFSTLHSSTAWRSRLPDDSVDSLVELRGIAGPCACVVRSSELENLRCLGAGIVDRGRKNPAKGLASLLLGRSEIPLIETGYSVAGRLVSGVRALLKAAGRRGESNLYVIGVEDGLFDALWSGTRWPESDGKSHTDGEEPLLGLLAPRKVPTALVGRFVGSSDQARLVRQLVMIAADHDEPVLILGDTGTGKEVVARAIHDYSDRRTQTFAPVNCGAIPRELLESELYGHERGAFTGAHRRKAGLWRSADRGTIFLDEVGDLPLDQQVKVLRAIDHGAIRAVGAESEMRVDARVIAATNRDLWAMVQAGEFRQDLYYRLRAFLVRTPALRRHPADIPLLAQHFWRRITGDAKSRLPAAVLERLEAYRWPGNARELKSVLASLHVLFGEQKLGMRHLRAVFRLEGRPAPRRSSPATGSEIDLHRIECLRHLRRVDEVLGAVEIALAPLGSRKSPSENTVESMRMKLCRHLGELDQLSSRAVLFNESVTFSVVRRLAERLEHLESRLGTDVGKARRSWRTEGRAALDQAREAVVGSVQRLLDH